MRAEQANGVQVYEYDGIKKAPAMMRRRGVVRHGYYSVCMALL